MEKLDFLNEQFDFSGCKIALFCEGKLLATLRDDLPTIPWPNMWELPGGGREEDESPFDCVLREVEEELGLSLSKDHIVWGKAYPGMLDPERLSIFMVGQISYEEYSAIVFGDEGQGYRLMSVEEFLAHRRVIPSLQERLRDYLEERDDYLTKGRSK